MITRYNAPTKYDKYEAGVICKTLKDIDIPSWDTCNIDEPAPASECFDLYIQVARNKENPKWKPICDFFRKVFGEVIYDKDLTKELMRLYRDDKCNSFLALSSILKEKSR